MIILSVDIGGTHVKFRCSNQDTANKFESGTKMTAQLMVDSILEKAALSTFDHVSIGYPGPVVHDRPLREPFNLAKGWVNFGWADAFGGKPLRMMNDAALQALGSYNGGRMLFLGLGTGLGSAMIVEGVVEPMELAHLLWHGGKTYEDFLGVKALKHDGKKAWLKHVYRAIDELSEALGSECVVLGGGNAKLVTDLPKNVTLGTNENAIFGGFDIWKSAHNLNPSQHKGADEQTKKKAAGKAKESANKAEAKH